jgi:lipopolysaccharide assembly outer membrane protein LptD (OstA)
MRIFVLIFAIWPFAARAEVVDFSADDGLVWDMQKLKLSMRKNATAKTPEYDLRADNIDADYREGKKIHHIFAQGSVRLVSANEEILSDTLDYDLDTETIVLEPVGNPVLLLSDETKFSARGRVVYYKLKNYATAVSAFVENGGRTMASDEARVEFKSVGGKNELSRIFASGHVKIVDGLEEMYGDKAEYNPKTGLATLTDNVSFKKGDGAAIYGGKIIYDMKSGVANILPKSASDKVTGKFVTGGAAKK